MKKIVLTRIDDRLLHGQVIVSWIPFLNIDEIVIIDDEYAGDDFMSSLIKEASPEHLKVDVLTVEESKEYLESDDDGNRILILSRFVENIERLITSGIKIDKVNIGGLGFCKGRKKFVNAIHLSDSELELLKDISSGGTEVEVQMLPKDKAIKL
nr:PTS sugar transporter subunit IIB [Sedimentibacter sp.]